MTNHLLTSLLRSLNHCRYRAQNPPWREVANQGLGQPIHNPLLLCILNCSWPSKVRDGQGTRRPVSIFTKHQIINSSGAMQLLNGFTRCCTIIRTHTERAISYTRISKAALLGALLKTPKTSLIPGWLMDHNSKMRISLDSFPFLSHTRARERASLEDQESLAPPSGSKFDDVDKNKRR